MTRSRLPINTALALPRRRGGARGTGGASGSPPDDLQAAVLTGFPLLIDSREVARLLGIGRTKAFELMGRGELPVVRIGRCVRVSRNSLDAWVAARVSPIEERDFPA